MTSAAKTARPDGAAIAWATKDAIFLEIPGPTQPYICRYPRNATGLAQALNILVQNCDPLPPDNRKVKSPDVKRVPKLRDPSATTEERAKALEVVKKMFKEP